MINDLRYQFEYNAEFIKHRRFYSRRRQYMIDIGICAPDFRHTSKPFSLSYIGNLCLGHSLGKGLSGKVYAAFNSAAELIAIKELRVMKNQSTARSFDRHIHTLTSLAELAVVNNDEGRILRLREVLETHGTVMLVLEPVVDYDFRHLINIGKDRTGL